jgi:hypothetical protein
MAANRPKRVGVKLPPPVTAAPLPPDRLEMAAYDCGDGKTREDCRAKFSPFAPAAPAPAIPGKPLEPPHAPPADTWFRSIMTDHQGDFDLGAVLVGVVAVFMCLNSGYDTIALHKTFNAQEFGAGIGAMLLGFAAYKFGDAKRAPPWRGPVNGPPDREDKFS